MKKEFVNVSKLFFQPLLIFGIVVAVLLSSCNDSHTSPIQGKWMAKGAVLDMKAKPEYVEQVDALVAAIGQSLGLPITNLQQLNQMGTLLLSQALLDNLTGIEVVNEGDLDLVLPDGIKVRTQFNLSNNKFTVALPKELTGMVVPLPLQSMYARNNNELRLYIEKEQLIELANSPLIDLVIPLGEGSGLPQISKEEVLQFLEMFESISLSLYLETGR